MSEMTKVTHIVKPAPRALGVEFATRLTRCGMNTTSDFPRLPLVDVRTDEGRVAAAQAGRWLCRRCVRKAVQAATRHTWLRD